jgi:hypothetical protein
VRWIDRWYWTLTKLLKAWSYCTTSKKCGEYVSLRVINDYSNLRAYFCERCDDPLRLDVNPAVGGLHGHGSWAILFRHLLVIYETSNIWYHVNTNESFVVSNPGKRLLTLQAHFSFATVERCKEGMDGRIPSK